MWPRTDLLELLGITHPIIQAPMAGSTTPKLAAAVSNAGGLGSLGCATLQPDALKESLGALRHATNQPFNLNFFAHREPHADPAVVARTRERLAPFYRELGIDEIPSEIAPAFGHFDEATLALLLDAPPPVVSFHFGLPEAPALAALKEAGCRLLCSATTVAEARSLEAAGVDAIIAQGWEAGGHRGSFETNAEDVGVGTMALVPQIVDAVQVPVIAAGGIADGRGIAAAFALGASGVQMGTAFLSCPEADVGDAHRKALRQSRDDDTRLTRAFSGRPARARNNRYMEAMAAERAPLPEFPLMYGLAGPLKEADAAAGQDDFQFLLYGQAAPLNREVPAGDLIGVLVAEAARILGAD